MTIEDQLDRLTHEEKLLEMLKAEIEKWRAEVPPEKLEFDIGADHFTIRVADNAIEILSHAAKACRHNIADYKTQLEADLTSLLKDLQPGVR